MAITLRIIGAFWIFWTAKPCYWAMKNLLATKNIHSLSLVNACQLAVLIGAVGLLFLQEWARWVLLVGLAGWLLLVAGNQVLDLHFTATVIRNLLFYGIFIIILGLPQSRSATR